MLKHAFLITAHAYPGQLRDIIDLLSAPNHYFFINVDRKAHNMREWGGVERDGSDRNCYFLKGKENMEVAHGGYSQIDCTLRLLRKAYDAGMDYFHLISGQDYPCRSNEEFDAFFKKNEGRSYMHYDSEEERNVWLNTKYASRVRPWYFSDMNHRNIKIVDFMVRGLNFISRRFWWRPNIEGLYAGWNWFSWHRRVVSYVLEQLERNPSFFRRFRHTSCADELIFHTLLAPRLKELSIDRNNSLRYVNWVKKAPGRSLPNAPLILNEEEYDEIMESGAFFCRKVHPIVSVNLINKLRKEII